MSVGGSRVEWRSGGLATSIVAVAIASACADDRVERASSGPAPPPDRCALLDDDDLSDRLGLELITVTQLSGTGCAWTFERDVDVTLQILEFPDRCALLSEDAAARTIEVGGRDAVIVPTPTQVSLSVCRDDVVATLVITGPDDAGRDDLVVEWAEDVEGR